MKLDLKKPIAFFDLETTGVDVSKDRIVEIAILKINPNQSTESKTMRINPTIPIPKEASKIHGITDEDLINAPTFKQVAKDIAKFIEGCDLGGYNSNQFDIPLLAEEFLRADIDFNVKNRKFIDVQVIYHKMEQRTLSAAYKFYCNKDLEGAHGAEADTTATYEVLLAQIDKYENLSNDVEELSKISYHRKSADLAGRIVFNSKGEEIFNFGKHKGKTVEEVLEKEPGYFSWMLNADFPLYTKKVLTEIKLRKSGLIN
ncbi:MAG: 3'-5' exonuclease [Bacteroidales bacterium]|nr:3'-5' exonuclease [Bacteroidales bacterium]